VAAALVKIQVFLGQVKGYNKRYRDCLNLKMDDKAVGA
jgi:hypothetical protein